MDKGMLKKIKDKFTRKYGTFAENIINQVILGISCNSLTQFKTVEDYKSIEKIVESRIMRKLGKKSGILEESQEVINNNKIKTSFKEEDLLLIKNMK